MKPLGWTLVAVLAIACQRDVRSVWPRSQERWRAVLAGHAVRDASPPPSLRYAVPQRCRLVYAWTASTRLEMVAPSNPMPAQGIEVTARGEGAASATTPGRWELGVPWMQLSILQGQERNPGPREEGIAAAVWLRTDGRSWREDDGPTKSWAALGTFNGLVRFFPTLPSGTAPGSEADWRYRVYARDAGAAVEARRGGITLPRGYRPRAPQGEDRTARVRIARWISVDGRRIAVIESMERLRTESSQPMPSGTVPGATLLVRTSRSARGEHLVMAPSGRVLLSLYDETVEVHMGGIGGQSDMDQRQTTHAEMRLVEACDGPVLASPIAPATPQERALDAVVRLRNALYNGDRTAAASALSPALLQRHGEAAVIDLLTRHVRRHGLHSLGSPEINHEPAARTAAGTLSLRLTGRIEHARDDQNVTGDTRVVVEEVGDRTVVRSIATDSVQGASDHDVLDVSLERLFSDVGP